MADQQNGMGNAASGAEFLRQAFNLPPQDALEWFRAKHIKISPDALSMLDAVRAHAFTVTGVLRAEVLQDIGTALENALAQGKPLAQFIDELKPVLQARGWWGVPHDPATGEVRMGRGMTPSRLRTVYNTNLQSAYMSGRYRQQLANAKQRPYWQYVAVLDNRTRPTHRAMNGRIFKYDDPVWGIAYPPNGYNCRCRVRALSDYNLQDEGGVLSSSEGQLETVQVETGPKDKRMAVPVTGLRDPVTRQLWRPDVGFDHSPAQGSLGVDVALAQRVAALKSSEVRTQVWQQLNGSPARYQQYVQWANRVLNNRAAANSVQVIGFVDDAVTAFMAQHTPQVTPVRVLAINEKRLLHADMQRHHDEGIALNREQLMMLPKIISHPDDVYYDKRHHNYVYVRRLVDGSVAYVAVLLEENLKRTGRLDAVVNAYLLRPIENGAERLLDESRFVKLSKTSVE